MRFLSLTLLALLLFVATSLDSFAQDAGSPAILKKIVAEELKGFPQENITIPVTDASTARVRIDNKNVAIDGYWEFKDDAGTVLAKPIIKSQPIDLNDQMVFALRSVGRVKISITEGTETKFYALEVAARFAENSIEKEVEAAIMDFVGDPGLRVRMMPPQSALVGANMSRSFGSETASEILAPRGETAGTATGASLSADDFRSTIILSGSLENELVSDKALNVAYAYSNNIVNLTSIRNYLQMKIRVKVISVEHTEDSNIGIQYRSANNPGTVDGVNGFGMGFRSSAPFFEVVNGLPIFGGPINAAGGDIRADVNLGKITGKAVLLQEPTLTVLNGQPAEFNVGASIPVTTTTVVPPSTTPITTVIFRQIGVTLKILPLTSYEQEIYRPNVDNSISLVTQSVPESGIMGGPRRRQETVRTIDENGVMKMLIQPSISSLGAIVAGQPSFNTNYVETRVAMKTGQSLVIGGLFDDQTKKNLETIPFIEKIPIIGELFKNRTTENTKKELVFVLEPEVLGLNAGGNTDFGLSKPLEDDINQRKIGITEVEKMLVDGGSRKPASKPVRISAASVTPRSVSLIEKAPTDFPPVDMNEYNSSLNKSESSSAISLRKLDVEPSLEPLKVETAPVP